MTQTKKVTLNPGESQEVAFSYTPKEARTYYVTVDGLSGSFEAITPPEAVIVLYDLDFPSPVIVGQIVPITCKAVLKTAPVGVPVTRTVTLFINGAAVESQEVTLTREHLYDLPSTTVRFSFIPNSIGTYSVEIDGLAGVLEVVELPNYLTFTGIELVSDARGYFQAILDAEYGEWVCPCHGTVIPYGCKIEDGKGKIDTSPIHAYIKSRIVDWRGVYQRNLDPCVYDKCFKDPATGRYISIWAVLEAYSTKYPACLDKDEKIKIGRILDHDIGLISVDDIGFNGEVGWATIRVSQTRIDYYYSQFELLAVVADRYADFLAGIGDRTDTRYLNGRGDRYHIHFAPRRVESMEETISASGEFHRRISYPPAVFALMPPGNYIVVIVAEQNYFNGKSFDTEFFKVWRVGEITF